MCSVAYCLYVLVSRNVNVFFFFLRLTLCMLRVVRDLRTGLLPWGGSVLVVGLCGVCIVTPLRVGWQPSSNVVPINQSSFYLPGIQNATRTLNDTP